MNVKRLQSAGIGTAAATLLAPISWGTTYVTVTELLPAGRPLLVAAVRVVPAGIMLLIAGAFRSRWRPRGGDWWRTGLLAAFNFGIFFPLLITAVYRLPGGVAAAVGGLQPLLVLLLSWLIGGDRPRSRDLIIGAAAALGVALVVIRPGADLDSVGLLAALGANVSFACGVVLTRRFEPPSNRLAATGWQLLLGGVLLVPLMAVFEGAPPAMTGRNLAGFTYLSLVGTGLAFALWFNGIRRLPAPAPPLLGLAAPVTGAVLGWVVLAQALSPVQLVGFVVSLAAIGYGASLQRSATGRSARVAAEKPEQPVLERSAVGHRHLGTEDDDARAERVRDPHALVHRLGDRPHPRDLVGVDRVVLPRGAGEIPAVHDEVLAGDLVDVVGCCRRPHRRVALGRGERRIGEHGLDVGAGVPEGDDGIRVH
jgi:probable blue pigment (indigoidine) exporter